MPFCYRCLLDWNEQIRVSHVQFKKSLLFLVEVSLPGCLLGGINTVLVTGLSPNLVILARLLGWTLLSGTVSETKTCDVLVCLILPLRFAERTVFWPFVTSWRPEMTEFSL